MNNKKHLTALATTALLTTSLFIAGAAQAATSNRSDGPSPSPSAAGLIDNNPEAIGVAFEPRHPLSPLSQQNAVNKAEDYLDYTAFSRQGLIAQLEYDGFSTQDATFAVDSITVDWNEQAAKKAQDYLDYTSFSRSGLTEQLMYDGFTPAQAAYGVADTGL